MANLSLLQDNFNIGSTVTSPWTANAPGITYKTGGKLLMTPDTSTFPMVYSTSGHTFDSVYAEVIPSATMVANQSTELRVYDSTDFYTIWFAIKTNSAATSRSLDFYTDDEFGIAHRSTTTYNPTTHRFLRIQFSSGTLTWSASPNGSTWTSIGSGSFDFPNTCRVELYAGNGSVAFDNVNTVGPDTGSMLSMFM